MAKKSKKTAATTFEPIAIVGMGCLFPGQADDPDAYWANCFGGIDCITEVPTSHWQISDYYDENPNTPDKTYGKRGGFIDPVIFDCLTYGISPANLEATDTTQLLAMVVTRQALRDAGFATGLANDGGKDFPRERTSVIMGVTSALELLVNLGARLGHPHWRRALQDSGLSDELTQEVIDRIGDAYVPWQREFFPRFAGNVAAGRIASRFDLGWHQYRHRRRLRQLVNGCAYCCHGTANGSLRRRHFWRLRHL